MTRILFVCLGNICRSPTAHAVLRRRAEEAGLDLTVDSAGTGDWHIGAPPHPSMIRTAEAAGIPMADLRARRIMPRDFEAFDLILAMDARNLADTERLRPEGSETEVRLFLDDGGDVPDPYYTGEFDRVLEIVDSQVARLIAQLQ